MYYKPDTNERFSTHSDIRRAFPNVSLPEIIADNDLSDLGVFPLNAVDSGATYRQNAFEGTPEYRDDGWWQTWAVTEASAEEIAERTDNQWTAVRAERNKKLADCDWTQLPDAPVDAAAWATYRQELRDITTQTDPFNITWPTEPGA